MISINKKTIIFLYVIFSHWTESTVRRVCVSKSCLRESRRLFRYLDQSVDPCDNFYDFVCGNFIKNTVLPPNRGSVTVFGILGAKTKEKVIKLLLMDFGEQNSRPTDLVRNLFFSCVDLDGVEENGLRHIKRIFNSICGRSVFTQNNQDTKCNWIKSLQNLHMMGYNPTSILSVSILPNLINSEGYIITVDEPRLTLPKNDYSDNNMMQIYYNYMIDIAVMFGAERPVAAAELRAVLELESELAKLTVPRETMSNMTSKYRLMDLRTLRLKYPYFPWLDYIHHIFYIHNIDESEPVFNLASHYFERLGRLLDRFDSDVIMNFIFWHLIRMLTEFLPQRIQDRTERFSRRANVRTNQKARMHYCLSRIYSSLPHAIGSLYVRKYFDDESKSTAEDMVLNLQLEFVNVLLRCKWLDYTTKLNAISKVSNMVRKIGYPDELLNDTLLDEYYEKLVITRGNYLQSYVNITIFSTIKMAEKLRDNINRKDWRNYATATDVNAYYDFMWNSILFPAAILQNVFFSKSRPRYMNYGAIGLFVGHEIMHGFDTTGGQFDKVGNLNNWWDPKTFRTYIAKARSFIHQYNNYTVPGIDMKVDGKQTVEENIADNGGMKVVYRSYNKWAKATKQEPQLPGLDYSPEQMFWICAASVWCGKHDPQALKDDLARNFHSPGMIRVIGTFSNSEEFANDFHCPKNSKMNRENKCLIFYTVFCLLVIN